MPRPKLKEDNKKMTNIQIRIEDALKREIQAAVQQDHGLPLSSWLRMKIVEYLRERAEKKEK